MYVEKKFKPGDRVSVDREALATLETLFPDGFENVEGTVTWARADVTYPEHELIDYIYTVQMDQDPSVVNLQFKTSELSMVLPLAIRQLDLIITNMGHQLDVLKKYRETQAKELGL